MLSESDLTTIRNWIAANSELAMLFGRDSGTGYAPVGWVEMLLAEHDRLLAEHDRLLAEVERLRDALRGVMKVNRRQRMWCRDCIDTETHLEPCGTCAGCLAWQAAADALDGKGEGAA